MNYNNCSCGNKFQKAKYDERFGGFLLPFLTGAVVSAPFWYLGGVNRNQPYYQMPYQVYYQNFPPQNYPPYPPYPPYR